MLVYTSPNSMFPQPFGSPVISDVVCDDITMRQPKDVMQGCDVMLAASASAQALARGDQGHRWVGPASPLLKAWSQSRQLQTGASGCYSACLRKAGSQEPGSTASSWHVHEEVWGAVGRLQP